MCRAIARASALRAKRGTSSHRARRVREGNLAGGGGRSGGAREASLRRRVRALHTSFGPIYGYAPRGKRLHLFGAQNPGQEHDLTLKYDRQRDGGPSLTVEGATTARVFEAYG